MNENLQRYLAGLVERMQRGERSAFDKFAGLLKHLVSSLLPGDRPEWDRILHPWITSMAIRVARPVFRTPTNMVLWIFEELTTAAAGLVEVEDLQNRITVCTAPIDSGIEIGTARRTKAWLSGDFVDVVADGDWIWIILGDARYHGPAPAYYANTVVATLRACLCPALDLADAVRRANELLFRHRPGPEYAVAQVAAWNRHDRALYIVNAGLTVRPMVASVGVVTTVEVAGSALGWDGQSRYDVVAPVVLPKDLLVLASDGITDQCDTTESEYGQDRLRNFVAGHGELKPHALAAAILDDVSRHSGGVIDDDQTVVVARF